MVQLPATEKYIGRRAIDNQKKRVPFKRREHIQEEHGPYFEVSAIQALSVTLA